MRNDINSCSLYMYTYFHFVMKNENKINISYPAAEGDRRGSIIDNKKIIKNNSQHCIIDDLIDIDPDRSMMISYCNKCFITVDKLNQSGNQLCIPTTR